MDARTGVTFELDGADMRDGRLVVRGRWSGVRGMRFMRPALIVAGRQLLAALDHKPWAPDADPWVAAFAWDGDPVDPARAELVVAPTIAVRLDGTPVRQVEDAAPPDVPEGPPRRRITGGAPDRERDRALAQRDEAEEARAAAVRTRDRMAAQLDEALQGRREAEAARDRALAAREEVRMQRDEVLAAHRALQAEVDHRWATAVQGIDPAVEGSATGATAADTAETSPEGESPGERPLGVLAIPAARAAGARLQARSPARPELSRYDLWAIRFFATIAAAAFVLLLVMLLRLFL